MLFPLRTDVPLRSTPWMNWLLIVLNVLIFIFQLTEQGEQLTYSLMLTPRDAKIWQYFTYMFLHGGGMHLAGNMLFLYIFGNNINDRMGHWGYLAFYLAGGVFAGTAHVFTDLNPALGASGAVAAVTGAFLILFPRARVTIFYFFILIGVAEIASLWFIGGFFLWDVFSQLNSGHGASRVAHMAHIGGSLCGAGVCLGLLKLRLLPRNQWDVLALIDRWNRRRQYRGVVATGYNPFDYTRRAGKQPVDPKLDRIIEIRAAIAESVAHSNLPEAVKGFMELRAVDPSQVLSKTNQLDIANYLYQQDAYAAAADAYEGYLRVYPKGDQIVHVTLILGLIYARYLNRPDRAEALLKQVIDRVHEGREVEIARAELAKLPGNTSTNNVG